MVIFLLLFAFGDNFKMLLYGVLRASKILLDEQFINYKIKINEHDFCGDKIKVEC